MQLASVILLKVFFFYTALNNFILLIDGEELFKGKSGKLFKIVGM